MATSLARRMIEQFGLDPEIGPVFVGHNSSEGSRARAESAVGQLLRSSLSRSRSMLMENRDAHTRIVNALLEHETLTAEQLRRAIAADPI